MKKVHQMRSGAPDKINIWTDGSYELIKHDMTNLVDYTIDELSDIHRLGEYILPADEGDIKHANKLCHDMWLKGFDQSWIILPLVNSDEYKFVIPHDQFVPKNSTIYSDLPRYTSVKYPEFDELTIEQFKEWVKQSYAGYPIALKTSTGSGSRGVLLIDKSRVHLGGKYRSKIDEEDINQFIKFAEKENCKILLQQLIPNDPKLMKVNVDFVIKDKQLLGYKWDLVNQSQVFTNWDNFEVIRNEYTDKIMSEIHAYLVASGITDAVMNFEAYSDLREETWMIEFNWRYSNSMFEAQAFGIDLVGQYLKGEPFEFPYGATKCSRYWQCKQYDKINGYKEGK